jgi:RNA polymerase sigma-70 factor (ECF subfamily)
MHGDVLTSFLSHLSTATPPAPAQLSAAIAALVESAQRRWPALAVPAAAFGEFLAERVDADPLDALARLRGDDLYLACACLQGDPRALHALDVACLTPVADKLRRAGLPAEAVADARQKIAELLLVPGERSGPRLATYSGRGDLVGWLYVAIAREARRLAQREARYAPADGADLADETIGADPELTHLKTTYSEAFRAAFHAAMDELDERERNLLRQHLLDGLSIDRIAALHQIHRATAARQLARVRERLAERTRARMIQQFGVEERESESILRLIRSQLDLSITRVLGRR